ncbi:MAG: hypothetical protein R3301_02740, partial [Saprospiraceae bacterium]|nr:hypothetical protein [Saprospiraceae bacterium]
MRTKYQIAFYLLASGIMLSVGCHRQIEVLSSTDVCPAQLDLPDIPGWNVEAIEIPGSYNRSWSPYFVNRDLGFLYGSDRHLYRTTDGGLSWSDTSWTAWSFRSMSFVNDSVGYLAVMSRSDGNGYLFVTSDAGKSWTRKLHPQDGLLSYLNFLDEQRGFALLRESFGSTPPTGVHFVETTDGGESWLIRPVAEPAPLSLSKLRMQDNGFGYMSGPDGSAFLTTDYGNAWHRIETGMDWFSFIQFTDRDHGFVSSYRQFLKTNDGGVTWSQISDLPVERVHFFSASEGMTLQSVHTFDHGDYHDYCRAFLMT